MSLAVWAKGTPNWVLSSAGSRVFGGTSPAGLGVELSEERLELQLFLCRGALLLGYRQLPHPTLRRRSQTYQKPSRLRLGNRKPSQTVDVVNASISNSSERFFSLGSVFSGLHPVLLAPATAVALLFSLHSQQQRREICRLWAQRRPRMVRRRRRRPQHRHGAPRRLRGGARDVDEAAGLGHGRGTGAGQEQTPIMAHQTWEAFGTVRAEGV